MRFLRFLCITLLPLVGASSIALAQDAQPTTAPAATAPAEELARGRLEGQVAAQSRGTSGWAVSGFLAGAGAGLIGTGVVWAIAAGSDVSPPADRRLLIVNQSAIYQQGFEMGYGEKLKSRRKRSALTGGLVGTAVAVVAILGSQGN